MKKLVTGLVLLVFVGLIFGGMWARAASSTPKVESIAIGSPVVVVMVDGKPTVRGMTSVLLLLRSDGSVGWTLSEEAAKDFDKKAKDGPMLPRQYGGKRK